jgi:hypothetical protein
VSAAVLVLPEFALIVLGVLLRRWWADSPPPDVEALLQLMYEQYARSRSGTPRRR